MQEELRKEMAEALLSGFIKEMLDLGFSKNEIITRIEAFDEEEEL